MKITINGNQIEAAEGQSILEAAGGAGIYIPALCSHPDLKPFRSVQITDKIYQGDKIFYGDPGVTIQEIKGCGICVVEIEGEEMPKPACATQIAEGMIIHTDTESIRKKRRDNLVPIMGHHPHSCLTCSQREGCLTLSADCSNSVPLAERCCELNGNCEIQRIADYVGIAPETPKYHHPGIPRIEDGGLFIRDYNICISCGRCVRACQQLRDVNAMGAVINDGKLIVGTVNGPLLSEAECRFCGACVEVCPTGSLQDKKKPRLKDESDYVPCKSNCPGDVEIPKYLHLINEGKFNASAEIISARLSFPNSLGKICFHPCETDCRRNTLSKSLTSLEGAVGIRAAKDFVMSRTEFKKQLNKQPDTGKKVAVIGAGPAGLTAGFYLSLKGHSVTIYDKENEPGGMLRYGIPDYRLPVETLKKDIDRLIGTGIKFKNNMIIGEDISLSSILNNGCDALYIAVGLPKSKPLPAEIPQTENIYYGVEFLNRVANRKITMDYFENHKVGIIGGGNVATDAARTAIRLGAAGVTIVCLEQFEEMPAYKQELDEAIEEGIKILNGWGISKIENIDVDRLRVQLVKCLRVYNENGKFSPEFDDKIINECFGDSMIICIGQEADISFLNDGNTDILSGGLIRTINNSSRTNIEKIFAGGDIVSGPSSVIGAVGAGKKAAREIDQFLGGNGIISGDEITDVSLDKKIGKIDGFCKFERMPVNLAPAIRRIKSFEPVELGYDENQAQQETLQCLQCNLRLEIRQNPYPPKKYMVFNKQNILFVPSEEGVIQLLDAGMNTTLVKGGDNMLKMISGFLDDGKEAAFFSFEPDQLFSQRESELIQQHLQKYGEMPDSGDDLDDLF